MLLGVSVPLLCGVSVPLLWMSEHLSNKAAAHYGDIWANLEHKGKSIGVNDVHIAGHARSEGLTLSALRFVVSETGRQMS